MSYRIIKAKEKHFDEIIPLLFSTGYYEYSAQNNKLNLSPMEFHKLQSLKPYLDYMYVLVYDKKVIGFYIAVTKKQLNEIVNHSSNEWVYRPDSALKKAIEKILAYYQNETLDNDMIALNGAIHPEYQGKKLFKMLKGHWEKSAKKQECSRVIFSVWSSNPAHEIFKHCGAQYFGEINCEFGVFQDKLLKGFFPLV